MLMIGVRVFSAGWSVLAAATVLVGGADTLFWALPGLLTAGWVQWRPARISQVVRARLWYAATPLWLLGAVPVALAGGLSRADEILTCTGLTLAAAATQIRSITHERLMWALHGPVPSTA